MRAASPMSPAIRSANIRRSPRPAASSVADAARLLRIRGRAMQEAVPVGVGAMAALLGLDLDAASAIAAEAAEGEVCAAANDNGAGQVVVSGDKAAVERAVEIAKARGREARDPAAGERPVPLRPDGAGRRGDGGGAGQASRSTAPAVPLVANVTAGAGDRPGGDPPQPRRAGDRHGALARDRSRWLAGAGVDTFVEVGAGKVLSGLAKRIADGRRDAGRRHAGRHRRGCRRSSA